MKPNKKHIAGIGAVMIVATYSLFRWRNTPNDTDE